MSIISSTALPCQYSGTVSDHDILAFLQAVHGDNPICFQTFNDDKNSTDKSLATNFHRSATRSVIAELRAMNARGAGIYHTVNETDGNGRKANNIIAINALFCDYDKVAPENLDKLPAPSAVVRSKNGLHLYWLLVPGQDITRFTAYQSMLAELTGGDLVVKDLPRVMRLPGFSHLKDPNDPFHVQLQELHPERRYSLADFPEPSTKALKAAKTKKSSVPSVSATRTLASLDALAKQYYDHPYVFVEPRKPREKSLIAKVRGVITKAELGTGANAAVYKASVIAAGLITKEKYTPSDALELVLKMAEERFSTQESSIAWNPVKDRDTVIGGLLAGLGNALAAMVTEKPVLSGATVTNCQYVTEMGIDYSATKITVVQSPIGTGKTRWLAQVIDAIAKDPLTRIRLVAHRISLTEQSLDELRQYGFMLYSDPVLQNVKSLASVPRLIVTYDSLNKLDGYNFLGGTVVLDEVDQGLNHLLLSKETEVRQYRMQAYNVLCRLLVGADYILAMSATASDVDVEALKEMAKSDDVQSFVNTHKPYQKRIVALSNYDLAYSKVVALLEQKRKVALPMDSAKSALAIHTQLAEEYPDLKIACVTAATKDQYDLSNINELVKQYDLFIYSPTLGTGIDISYIYFDYVVAIFTNGGMPYQDALQQLGRVRYPKQEVFVFIDEKDSAPEASDEAIRAAYCLDKEALMAVDIDPETCRAIVHPAEEFIVQQQLARMAHSIRGRDMRSVKFYEALEEAGHVVTNRTDWIDVTHTKDDVKDTKEILEEQHQMAVAQSEVLSYSQFEALVAKKKTSKGKLTPKEELQLSRAYVAKGVYGDVEHLVDIQDVSWYEEDGRAILKTISLALKTPGMRMQADKEWSETTAVNGGYDGKFYVKNGEVLDTLLASLAPVIEAGQYTKSDLDCFMEVVRKVGLEAVRQLGVRCDERSPVAIANALLKLNGWKVDKKLVTAVATPSISVSLREKLKDGVARKQVRLYKLSRNEMLEGIVTRLNQEAEDAKVLEAEAKEYAENMKSRVAQTSR